jgi:hypothetical protein
VVVGTGIQQDHRATPLLACRRRRNDAEKAGMDAEENRLFRNARVSRRISIV